MPQDTIDEKINALAIKTGDVDKKLISGLEVIDSTVVHTSGNEIIDGQKTFIGHYTDNESNNAGIIIRNTEVTKGVNPSSTKYWSIALCDATHAEWTSDEISHGRLGLLETILRPNRSEIIMSAYPNDLTNGTRATIAAEIDADGIPVGRAPSTSENRNIGVDIVTRDWIPKDTRIVHTTGNEIITGIKSFKNTPNNADNFSYVTISHPYVTKGTNPTNSKYAALIFTDNTTDNVNRLGIVENVVNNQGDTETYMVAYKNESNNNTTNAILKVGRSADGTAYANAPSTLTTRTNGTDIVTRDFIPNDTRIVHTTGNETVNGEKTFKSNVVIGNVGWNAFIHKRTDVDKTSTSVTGWYGLMQIQDKNGNAITSMDLTVSANYTDLNITTISLGSNNYNRTLVLSSNNNSDAGNFRTNSDNKVELGTTNYRWKQLYAATSTIATSDERYKSNIQDVSDTLLDAWGEVSFKTFQFNDAVEEKGSEEARIHVGLIAQQIKSVFEKHGLNPFKYGLLCYDKWKAEEEQKDEQGNIITQARPAGDRYSLRYEECMCLEAAYQRRELERIKAMLNKS